MKRINLNNIQKTFRYMKKNGIKSAVYAVRERLDKGSFSDYTYVPLTEDILKSQQGKSFNQYIKFSILVPCYETEQKYLKVLIDSALAQTYGEWELILADASSTDKVKDTVSEYTDERIRYVKLAENRGISENTNEGLKEAQGDYVVLLDHDDILTEDALYQMMEAIDRSKVLPAFLYSDEDKTDSSQENFFEPHIKPDFNYDLLLTNNYICHLLVIRTGILKRLKFRKEYDGAQDYDLVLRLVAYIQDKMEKKVNELEELICHVPKVLYHWRCHELSTAANPASKQYAYEAGLRALKDYVVSRGYTADVVHAKHLGYYELIEEIPDILFNRTEIGAVGGVVYHRGRISTGPMDAQGLLLWPGAKKHYSGYMNRIASRQNVKALHTDKLYLKKDIIFKFIEEKVAGCPEFDIVETKWDGIVSIQPKDGKRAVELSLILSDYLTGNGYLLLYLPTL